MQNHIHRKLPKPSIFLSMALSVLLIIGLRIVFYHPESLETDEGSYAYVAQEILRGKLPYADYFDHKPPLIYLLYALILWLSGPNAVAIKTTATLFVLLNSLLVYLLSRKLLSKDLSLLSGFVYLASISLPYIQGSHANTELFMTTFILLSLWLLLKNNPANIFLAGLSLGLAILFKTAGFANLLAIVIVLVISTNGSNKLKRLLRKGIVFATGFFIPLGITLAFFAYQHALDDFWFSNVTYNQLYIQQIPIYFRIFMFPAHIIIENPALWVLGLWGSYQLLRKRPHRLIGLLLGLNTFIPLLLIQYAGKGFPHYYIQIIPFLSIAGIYKFNQIKPSATIGKAIYSLIAISLILSSIVLYQIVLTQPADSQLKEKFGPYGRGSWYDQSPQLAQTISKYTNPGDYIYNLGRESQLYFYSQTRSASKYYYDRPLWLFPGLIKEVCREINRNQPKLIVNTLTRPYFSPHETGPMIEAIKDCGEFKIKRVEKATYAKLWHLTYD